MEYTLSPSQESGDEMLPPTETGGRIDIGGDGLKLGYPNSKATRTFTCGDKNKCVFNISVGSRKSGNHANFVDNEAVQITFTWGTNGSLTETYNTSETYPQRVELPTCGPVTLSITMIEGDNPGIESLATVAPIEYWCE
jgi:hypothetical protein